MILNLFDNIYDFSRYSSQKSFSFFCSKSDAAKTSMTLQFSISLPVDSISLTIYLYFNEKIKLTHNLSSSKFLQTQIQNSYVNFNSPNLILFLNIFQNDTIAKYCILVIFFNDIMICFGDQFIIQSIALLFVELSILYIVVVRSFTQKANS